MAAIDLLTWKKTADIKKVFEIGRTRTTKKKKKPSKGKVRKGVMKYFYWNKVVNEWNKIVNAEATEKKYIYIYRKEVKR